MAIGQRDGRGRSNAAQGRSGFALVAAETGRIEANIGNNGRAVFAIGIDDGQHIDMLGKVEDTDLVGRHVAHGHSNRRESHHCHAEDSSTNERMNAHGQSFRLRDHSNKKPAGFLGRVSAQTIV